MLCAVCCILIHVWPSSSRRYRVVVWYGDLVADAEAHVSINGKEVVNNKKPGRKVRRHAAEVEVKAKDRSVGLATFGGASGGHHTAGGRHGGGHGGGDEYAECITLHEPRRHREKVPKRNGRGPRDHLDLLQQSDSTRLVGVVITELALSPLQTLLDPIHKSAARKTVQVNFCTREEATHGQWDGGWSVAEKKRICDVEVR